MTSKWSFFDDDAISVDFVKVDEVTEPEQPKTICDFAVKAIREDRICKQKQNWPLVELSDVKKLKQSLTGKLFGNFPVAECKITSYRQSTKIDYENGSWSLFDKDVRGRYQPEKDFLKTLFREIPEGVVLAGGFLVKFLFESRYFYRSQTLDLDLFLVGDNPDETFVKIVRVIQDVFGDNIQWSRNLYVVNAVISNKYTSPTVIQIVTKHFKSKDLVIGNFDIAASSVLFDGQKLLFTPMAALTYATRTIFVDTQRKSLAFEYRIQKYGQKGFAVCFPELDNNLLKPSFTIGKLKLNLNKYGNANEILIDCFSKSVEATSTYGDHFVNSKALISILLKGTIDEKLYVAMDIDRDGNMTNYRISGKTNLEQLYKPLIPDIYEAPITHLRNWYNEKGFEALISTFTERDDAKRINLQNEIRNVFVEQLHERVQKICSTYGSQVEFFENIDPFRPDPVSGKTFYGNLYRDVGLDL